MKRARHDPHETVGPPTSRPPEDHVTLKESPEGTRLLRVPKISRRVHACTECQARKIKCDIGPGHDVCTRCTKKGLNCIVNKSLQSLLESENEWKTKMEHTTGMVQGAVATILQTLGLPSLDSFAPPSLGMQVNYGSGSDSVNRTSQQVSSQASRGMAMTRESSQEPEANEQGNSLIGAPMGSLYEVTRLRNLRDDSRSRGPHDPLSLEKDFISRGKVSEVEAESLFNIFSRSLNHYLWGVALVHQDLTSVRRSSTLLSAAILTVTSLHVPGKEKVFDICYAEFVSLVSEGMLDRYHSLDDIRGLCISAFWLSDLSWKLSGHAVRIATELNLHQSCARAIRGSRDHLEGARLWYFLYICDHHFSIAYGRPPVIHADAAIVLHEKLSLLSDSTESDLRLHSQVAIFIILTDIYNRFGPDIDLCLDEEDLNSVRIFNVSLDRWHETWVTRLATSPLIGSYPAKGVTLHYNFAKLQLNSLALRGFHSVSPHELSASRRELANSAISVAVANLQFILNEPDIRTALVGVPIYIHTMISYTMLFLLKVQQRSIWFGFHIDGALIKSLIKQVINFMSDARASERHLTYHIARGLTKLLEKFEAAAEKSNAGQAAHDAAQPAAQGNNAIGAAAPPGMAYVGGQDYPPPGMLDQSLLLQDENYFPFGFFDVLSSAIPG